MNEYSVNDTHYHEDHIQCEGCKKYFCTTLKDFRDEKRCLTCIGLGMEIGDFMNLKSKLDEVTIYALSTPVMEWSIEMAEAFPMINKKSKERWIKALMEQKNESV